MADVPITLALAGDVMTGRGVDQVLPVPGDARLHEPWVEDAREYVRLAEARNGVIARPVAFDYVWGDALQVLREARPDAFVINLETGVTRSDAPWAGKGIHYKMHPGNVPCLQAAGVDCCVLANNHVMDWGLPALRETVATLRDAGIQSAGAGEDLDHAGMPARLVLPGGNRVLVFSLAAPGSGVPPAWAATRDSPGVCVLPSLDDAALDAVVARVERERCAGDLVVASLHWGGNWGYAIGATRRRFARALIERAGVDVVHGHSSHHPLAIEVHQDRPILFGCGDLINDYEGIRGHEHYHPDLGLLYLLELDPAGAGLLGLRMLALERRRFRLHRAPGQETRWLADALSREAAGLGTSIDVEGDAVLALRWAGGPRSRSVRAGDVRSD